MATDNEFDLDKLFPLERLARIVVGTIPVVAVIAELVGETYAPLALLIAVPLLAAYPLASGIAGRDFLFAFLGRRSRRVPIPVKESASEPAPERRKRAA